MSLGMAFLLGVDPLKGQAFLTDQATTRRWCAQIGRTGKLRVQLRVTRSEEHTSELQSLMRISYAVFCLKKKKNKKKHRQLQKKMKLYINDHEYEATDESSTQNEREAKLITV